MPMILKKELLAYLDQKPFWAPSTLNTAAAKLSHVLDVGISDPQKLFDTLELDGLSRNTIKNYFTLAMGFEEATSKTCLIRNWVRKNQPLFKNCYKKKNKALTEKDFLQFLALTPNADLFNFLILMGRAGLRKSEAFQVTWSQVTEDSLEVRSGKGGKQRFVPFQKKWLNPSFKGDDTSFILPANLIYWKFFKEKCSPFTPHDFRSFYATQVVNIPGMSIEDARALLGHSDIQVTALYLRADQNRQKELILGHFK